MSSKIRSRSTLRKQIRWLCKQLAKHTRGYSDCPPNVHQGEACHNATLGDCAACWRQAGRWAVQEASFKAVEDADDNQ